MRKTVRTDGIEMDYCSFGQGDKAFVIIPGLSLFPVTPMEPAIRKAFSRIADDHSVCLFDRRSDPPEKYSIGEMAEDTYRVMKHLGLKEISLYGASQGGMIAQEIAVRYPSFVKELILGSSIARPNTTMNGVIGEWIRLAKSGDMKKLGKAFAEHVYSEHFAELYGDALTASFTTAEDAMVRRFLIFAESIREFDITDRLDRISAATLVIGCKGDRVFTGQASEEIARITGCELYMYGEEYGHAVYDEAPDYVGRICDFINHR